MNTNPTQIEASAAHQNTLFKNWDMALCYRPLQIISDYGEISFTLGDNVHLNIIHWHGVFTVKLHDPRHQKILALMAPIIQIGDMIYVESLSINSKYVDYSFAGDLEEKSAQISSFCRITPPHA